MERRSSCVVCLTASVERYARMTMRYTDSFTFYKVNDFIKTTLQKSWNGCFLSFLKRFKHTESIVGLVSVSVFEGPLVTNSLRECFIANTLSLANVKWTPSLTNMHLLESKRYVEKCRLQNTPESRDLENVFFEEDLLKLKANIVETWN